MSQKNVVRLETLKQEDLVIEKPSPTLTGVPKPAILEVEGLPALLAQEPVQVESVPTTRVDQPHSEHPLKEVTKTSSLIPSNRSHHSVKREFDGGNIRIVQVQEKGKSPYQVIVCRRKRTVMESGQFGEYEVCEVGPIKLITQVMQDRGFIYLRTEPDDLELPDEWATCIQYQDLEIVRDGNCEDHMILIPSMLAKYALGESPSSEATKRLLDMFSVPYPWSTREPKLVRDGYSRTYLRLNPAMLRGEVPE